MFHPFLSLFGGGYLVGRWGVKGLSPSAVVEGFFLWADVLGVGLSFVRFGGGQFELLYFGGLEGLFFLFEFFLELFM